ncbi:MAG: hypothetical protein ACK5JN_09595 [Kluyvera sp.]
MAGRRPKPTHLKVVTGKLRSNAALVEAVSVITRHSWGTLEDAKKN